ncbi:hypothetical protein ACQP3L_40140, partial [Escherichia coli]
MYQISVDLCVVFLVLKYLILKIAVSVSDLGFVKNKQTNKQIGGLGVRREFPTIVGMALTILLPFGT